MQLETQKIINQGKIHFVTFTVTAKVDVFIEPKYRDTVLQSFKYCQEHKGLLLYGYVIMSNHIHLLIQSKEGALSDLIRDTKRHMANTIYNQILEEPEIRKDWILKRFEFAARGTTTNRNFKFWKAGNQPEEIISNTFFWEKLNFIHLNPIRQKIVEKASHYLYSSASNYVNKTGLIQVIIVSYKDSFADTKPYPINFSLW